MALQPDDSYLSKPAAESVEAIRLYAESLDRYGKSPFLYPIYGLGGLPEGFSRLCAIHGGTFILNKGVDEVLLNDDGTAAGVRSGSGADAHAAFGAALHKIETRIRRYKRRLKDHHVAAQARQAETAAYFVIRAPDDDDDEVEIEGPAGADGEGASGMVIAETERDGTGIIVTDLATTYRAEAHARDQLIRGELALDAHGKILAVRAEGYQNVGAYTEVSRQLMMQSSPAADNLVMNDLARVHSYYIYSLNAFVTIFQRSIDLVSGAPRAQRPTQLDSA